MNPGRIGFRRLIVTLPLGALVLSLLAFCLPMMAGQDEAAAVLRARYSDPDPDPALVDAVRAELGLDDPAPLRFGRFLANAATGDFGLSSTSRMPVWPNARRAVVVSLQLVVPTVTLAVVLGVVLGTVAAVRRGRTSAALGALGALGASLPAHVVGPLSVLVLGVWLRVLPTGGWESWSTRVLPIAVLAVAPTVMIAEVARTEMTGALRQSFVRTARAKGLGTFGVTRHAFAVSRQGVIAIGSVMTAGLLGGAVLVETIFSVPGLGRFLVDAVRNGDIPSLQCGLLLASAFALVVGAVADGLAVLADPRQRRRSR